MSETKISKGQSRRRFLTGVAATTGLVAAAGFVPTRFAIGQTAPVKIGFLLPYSGTYAFLGENITDAFKLRVAQAENLMGGRPVEFIQLDSEFAPPKAPEKYSKLVNSEKVDFVVGPVHSGVAMAMAKLAREDGTMMVNPNAGADAVTGAMCAPNIFRTSFSNWQPGFATGEMMIKDGMKTAVAMYWKYGAGIEAAKGFQESFEAGGGKVIKNMEVPFPEVEFQAYLTEIASLQPDAVFMFFAGGGAIKVNLDWAAAGLKGKVKLYGSGFLTEGILAKVGDAAEGVRTALHYADGLDNPTNVAFMKAFKDATTRDADVYAVQGYDAATLILLGLAAVNGDTSKDSRGDLIKAMETAEIDSPRGNWTLSAAHNPIQDMYAREVQGGKNVVIGMAHAALADPARGCNA